MHRASSSSPGEQRRVSIVDPAELRRMSLLSLDADETFARSVAPTIHRSTSDVTAHSSDNAGADDLASWMAEDDVEFGRRLLSAVRLQSLGVQLSRHTSVGSMCSMRGGGGGGGGASSAVGRRGTFMSTSVIYEKQKEKKTSMLQRIQGCIVRRIDFAGDSVNHQFESKMTAAELREKIVEEEAKAELTGVSEWLQPPELSSTVSFGHRENVSAYATRASSLPPMRVVPASGASDAPLGGASKTPLPPPSLQAALRHHHHSNRRLSGAPSIVSTAAGGALGGAGGALGAELAAQLTDLSAIQSGTSPARMMLPSITTPPPLAGAQPSESPRSPGTSPGTTPTAASLRRRQYAAKAALATASPRTRRRTLALREATECAARLGGGAASDAAAAAAGDRGAALLSSSGATSAGASGVEASRLPAGVRPTAHDAQALEAISQRLVRERLPWRPSLADAARLDPAKIAARIVRDRESMPRSRHLERKLLGDALSSFSADADPSQLSSPVEGATPRDGPPQSAPSFLCPHSSPLQLPAVFSSGRALKKKYGGAEPGLLHVNQGSSTRKRGARHQSPDETPLSTCQPTSPSPREPQVLPRNARGGCGSPASATGSPAEGALLPRIVTTRADIDELGTAEAGVVVVVRGGDSDESEPQSASSTTLLGQSTPRFLFDASATTARAPTLLVSHPSEVRLRSPRRKSTVVGEVGFWRSGFTQSRAGSGGDVDEEEGDSDGVKVFSFEKERIRSEARAEARVGESPYASTAALFESPSRSDLRTQSIASLFSTDTPAAGFTPGRSGTLVQLQEKLKKLQATEAMCSASPMYAAPAVLSAGSSTSLRPSIAAGSHDHSGAHRRARVRVDGDDTSSSAADMLTHPSVTGRSLHERRRRGNRWHRFEATPFCSALATFEEAVLSETEPLPSELEMNIPLQDLHLYQLFCAHRRMTIILRPVSNAVPSLYAGVAFVDRKLCDSNGLPMPQPRMPIAEIRRHTVFECRAKGKSINVSLKSSSYPPIDGLIPVNPALGKAFLEAQKREREIEDMILSAQGGVMTVALLRKLKAQKAQAGSLTAAFVRDIQRALELSDTKCAELWRKYKEEVVCTVDKEGVSRRYIDAFNEAQFLGTTEAKWRGHPVYYTQLDGDKVLRNDRDVPIFHIKMPDGGFHEYDPVTADAKKERRVEEWQRDGESPGELRPVLVVTHRTFFIASTTHRIEEEAEAYIIGPDFDGLAYAQNIWAPSPVQSQLQRTTSGRAAAAGAGAGAGAAAGAGAGAGAATATSGPSQPSPSLNKGPQATPTPMPEVALALRRESEGSHERSGSARVDGNLSESRVSGADSPLLDAAAAASGLAGVGGDAAAPLPIVAPEGGDASSWSLEQHIKKAHCDTEPQLVPGMGLVTTDDVEHIREMRQLTEWKQNHGYESGNTIKSQPLTPGVYVTITPTCIRVLSTFAEIIGFYRNAWVDGTPLLLNPNWKVCIDPRDALPVPYGEEPGIPIIDDCGYAALLLSVDQLKSPTITYEALMRDFTSMEHRVAERRKLAESAGKKAHKAATDHIRTELLAELCLVNDKKHMAQLFYQVRRWQLYPPWFVRRVTLFGIDVTPDEGFEEYRQRMVAERMTAYEQSEKYFSELHPGSPFLSLLSSFLRPDPPEGDISNTSFLGGNMSEWRDALPRPSESAVFGAGAARGSTS